ncbi:MAG TPA: hypothetical protein PLE30_06005 [Candidatus Kapabacteria bacterium]|nr:hypothetical protein [Candidatus Kapabacteria bacterium]
METFNFDEEFAEEKKSDDENNDNDEAFFTTEELNEFLGDQKKIDDARSNYERIFGLIEESEQKIIKAEDVKENISDFDLENILNYSDEDRKQDFYTPTKDILEEEEHEREMFDDYLKYPKISGTVNLDDNSNLIPQKKVDDTKKTVEIKDETNDLDEHHTTIEIIRDQYEEIETIVVHCKCGEKTIIKFDYENDENSDELVSTKTKINPFSVEELKLKTID